MHPKCNYSSHSGLASNFGQLVSVQNDLNIATYTYNADGLRAVKTVDADTTKFLYESGYITLELDSSGVQIAHNVYGESSILSRTTAQGTRYYLYNGRGDVVQLTTSGGNVIATYDYDAFGNLLTGNLGDTNPFRYCGEFWDFETKNYYLRSRYYNTSTGRFTQRDSFLGFYSDPLSLNRYLYCSHNPIKYRDPWGDWQKGDEEYDLATQDELMAATQAYYAALERDDRDGMKAAQAAAQAARDAGTKGAHPAGVTPGSIYTDAITNSTHGYMTLADFKAADKEIIATSGQWTYYYTLLAIQATQNLDKLYPDVKTHNNLGLLAKGQGPQNQDLFALKNYWWLYDNVFKNKNSSHIMVNDEHLLYSNAKNH